MVASQTSGQRRLVKRSHGSNDHEPGRELSPVAEWAVEHRADVLGASYRGIYPWARQQRRAVSNVLMMMASKLGYPVADVVLPEPDDLALHVQRQPEQ
jgi:hypothetical protein